MESGRFRIVMAVTLAFNVAVWTVLACVGGEAYQYAVMVGFWTSLGFFSGRISKDYRKEEKKALGGDNDG